MRLFHVFFLTFVLFAGCGLLQKNTYSHYTSCGPTALFQALRQLDFNISRIEITREILDDHECYSFLREVLAIFNKEAKHITFPNEIISFLQKRNIQVTIVSPKELATLSTDRVAIVLLKKRNGLGYHWGCFPVDNTLSTFYGEGSTIVDRIFLLERRG